MNTYKVIITETLEREVTVEALTEELARQAVKEDYNECNIVLDSSDFKEVTIEMSSTEE